MRFPSFGGNHRIVDGLVRAVLFSITCISVAITVGIIVFTVTQSLPFFTNPEFSLWEFLTGPAWQPVAGRFGILPVLTATLMTVAIGLLFAMPVGTSCAIILAQYAPQRIRNTIKPVLEVAAGIPTIVYGFFALHYLTPLLRSTLGRELVSTYNTFSAGLTIGVLVLPLVITMADDAFAAVPDHYRHAPLGVGATRAEAFRKVVRPAARGGLTSVLVVVASRAIGESIIVSLAAGSGPNLTLNPFESAETITGYILRIARGEAQPGTVDYTSIFALGLVLFVITLALNTVATLLRARHRRLSS